MICILCIIIIILQLILIFKTNNKKKATPLPPNKTPIPPASAVTNPNSYKKGGMKKMGKKK